MRSNLPGTRTLYLARCIQVLPCWIPAPRRPRFLPPPPIQTLTHCFSPRPSRYPRSPDDPVLYHAVPPSRSSIHHPPSTTCYRRQGHCWIRAAVQSAGEKPSQRLSIMPECTCTHSEPCPRRVAPFLVRGGGRAQYIPRLPFPCPLTRDSLLILFSVSSLVRAHTPLHVSLLNNRHTVDSPCPAYLPHYLRSQFLSWTRSTALRICTARAAG